MASEDFSIKDSGKRQEFESGMKRDTTEDKVLWHLVFDGPMLERYAKHLTGGAKKYEPQNWMKANSWDEYRRFKESAFRHFMQWFRGDRDEDHAAAVIFNINGAEYTYDRVDAQSKLAYDTAFPPETRQCAREFMGKITDVSNGRLLP